MSSEFCLPFLTSKPKARNGLWEHFQCSSVKIEVLFALGSSLGTAQFAFPQQREH